MSGALNFAARTRAVCRLDRSKADGAAAVSFERCAKRGAHSERHFRTYVRYHYYAFWVRRRRLKSAARSRRLQIRCQVYIMGFVVGYFMHKTARLRMSKVSGGDGGGDDRRSRLQLVCLLGWTATVGVVAAITVPMRDWTLGDEMALGARAVYSALNRVGWAAALTWIVVACHYGYGGPIGAALNWEGWRPLGRLTYGWRRENNKFVICGFFRRLFAPLSGALAVYRLCRKPNLT